MTRIDKLRKLMKENEIEAMLIKNDNNRFYITGFLSSAGAVLITENESQLFIDSRYIEAAEKALPTFKVKLTGGRTTEKALIESAVQEMNIKTLGFEDELTPLTAFLSLRKSVPAELKPAGALLRQLRRSKDASELQAIKRAVKISETAFAEILPMIKPGVTERDIAAQLTYLQLKHGAEAMSFDPIVASGENSSMPHAAVSDRVITPGDFITMDFGCKKDGYCSDMTRTVAVSYVTPEMAKVYDTVLKAQLAGIAAARPSVTGKEIDAAGRSVIEKAGFGEYFGHSFGHGIGIDIHEAPNASPAEETAMPEGAVISAEPGIYIPGRFGVRIEDLLWLKESYAENLNSTAKSLIILH